MDKMDRDSNTELYRWASKYLLSKFIIGNGDEDLWRRENLDLNELTNYNRSSGTKSRVDWVYTDIRITNNTKINHMVVS